MTKRSTKELFVQKAIEIHGDKYDYSKVEYINADTKVCIICPTHGSFYQEPHTHLKGEGCRYCFYEKNRKELVCGFGVNDYDPLSVYRNKDIRKSYNIWVQMISRCYCKNNNRFVQYYDCKVSDEWSKFSSFYKWWTENYKEGYHLDKDLIGKEQRLYSPQTCCFVPQEINSFLLKRRTVKSDMPRGVSKKGNCFSASCYFGGKENYLGCYSNPDDAHEAYKVFKEKCAVVLANKWKDKIDAKVYNALLNFTLTD